MTTHPTPSPHDAIEKVRKALERAKTGINAGMKRHPWDCDCLVCYDLASADRAIGAALDALASLESALVTAASAHRAGQEEMRERAAAEFDKERDEALKQIERNVEYARRIARGDDLWSDSTKLCRDRAGLAERNATHIRALPLTDNAPDAEAGEPHRALDKDEQAALHVALRNSATMVHKASDKAALREEIARLGKWLAETRKAHDDRGRTIANVISDRDALASLEPALATAASAHRAGQEAMRERAAVEARNQKGMAAVERQKKGFKFAHVTDEFQIEVAAEERGENIAAEQIAARIRTLPLTDNAPGAKPLDYARVVLDDPVASSGAEAGEREALVQTETKEPSRLQEGRKTAEAERTALREEIARLGRDVTTWRDKSENLEYEYGRLLSDRDLLRAQVEDLTRERDALRKALKFLASVERVRPPMSKFELDATDE